MLWIWGAVQNNIQGTIPSELGNLKSLISLDLYNNSLTGKIPTSLGKLKSLVFLRLNDNQLTGPILENSPKSQASKLLMYRAMICVEPSQQVDLLNTSSSN
ncbi:hypothetical protein Bca52824_004763 [Brassica carinata]|uniref:Uncharacterized protein n=1 Tax=Brassica carinata TaxID=52824 RepID=A0A8X7WSL5_BRACI|nr:hypothetical protein Bca52824_004763 [Brassica carinata]